MSLCVWVGGCEFFFLFSCGVAASEHTNRTVCVGNKRAPWLGEETCEMTWQHESTQTRSNRREKTTRTGNKWRWGKNLFRRSHDRRLPKIVLLWPQPRDLQTLHQRQEEAILVGRNLPFTIIILSASISQTNLDFSVPCDQNCPGNCGSSDSQSVSSCSPFICDIPFNNMQANLKIDT